MRCSALHSEPLSLVLATPVAGPELVLRNTPADAATRTT
jgi:hypothetical protein